MPHSCQVVPLDEHFAQAPHLRAVFDAYLAAAELNGPVTVNATKSRVSLQARMRFAGIERPRKRHLVATFVLVRAIESDRLKVEFIPPRYYVHRLVLRTPPDVERRGPLLARRGLRRRRAEAPQAATRRSRRPRRAGARPRGRRGS